MSTQWQPLPTVTGWYWMRWRSPWGRKDLREVIFFDDGVRGYVIRTIGWIKIDRRPATRRAFYGPLMPPDDGETK